VTEPAVVTEQPPAAPPCDACGGESYVHWLRRLTPDETAVERDKEEDRRAKILALADTQAPPPVFPPLPDYGTWVHAVYGCLSHAIAQDAAALVHQATCTAPDPAKLPACNCIPETAPAPDADPTPRPLPPGWS
jgi:hypothetical protein